MRSFDDDWADQIWAAVNRVGAGGAAWRLPAAALAVTGARPAALERGIEFALVTTEQGKRFIEATIPGVKLTANRGQPEYQLRWSADHDTHRPQELRAIAIAMMSAPERRLVVKYDAEAISTRLREVSRRLWPRRRYQVTGYCYRELLASTAKAAGVNPAELAAALGHRSAESQGAYARAGRGSKTGHRRPFASAKAVIKVKTERAPMARFKAAAAIKKSKLRASV